MASAGSLQCIATCASTIYLLNGTINQCNDSCDLPYGIQTSYVGSPLTYLCSSCVTFINRNDSKCVSTCTYQNATTINSSAITVCEVANSS